MDRRQILLGMGGGLAAATAPWPAQSAEAGTDARLIVLILRGGLDGLSAVPAYGDPAFAAARGSLALGAPGSQDGVFDLDGTFGLHPALGFFHELYLARQLAVVHATATPYRNRSHFDGQNVLEGGGTKAFGFGDGWLNRSLAFVPGATQGEPNALAIGQTVPLILRGPNPVTSWSPSGLAEPQDDTIDRLMDLYQDDPLLAPALSSALATDSMLGDVADNPGQMGRGYSRGRGNPRRLIKVTFETTAKLMTSEAGPRMAVLEFNGWDSHANQGVGLGGLATRLGLLNDGLQDLVTALGPVWNRTAMLVVTEFGRTVGANGTNGTDHGTGGAAFLAGGAVQGGKVLADWPGLRPADLFEGRDLRPTIDLRRVFKGVLHDHMGVARAKLDKDVFPDSEKATPMTDLISA